MSDRRITNGVAVLCMMLASSARAEDENEARRFAERSIQQSAVRYLTDRKFQLEEELIAGTAEAIDPKENVKTEIKEFLFVPGRVTIGFLIDFRMKIDGTLEITDQTVDVSAVAALNSDVDLKVEYWFEDHRLQLNSEITDAKFKVEFLELHPSDLPGGNEAAEKLVAAELDRHKRKIIREINEWLEEQNRR